MEKYFNASLDKWSGGITLGISVLFAAIVGVMVISADNNNDLQPAAVVSGVFFSILLICYLLRPLGYIVSATELIICRPISNIKVPLSEIIEIKPLETDDLAWSIRTFGNGGLFGFYGNFWNKKLGSMTWYATRRGNYMLVKTKDKTIILTPDDQLGFIDSLLHSGAPVNALSRV